LNPGLKRAGAGMRRAFLQTRIQVLKGWYSTSGTKNFNKGV